MNPENLTEKEDLYFDELSEFSWQEIYVKHPSGRYVTMKKYILN